MVLLREELGDVLRQQRRAQGRTLRQVSKDAKVSLGYLSEIERGEKEASSELLSAVCQALGLPLSDALSRVAEHIASREAASTPVMLRPVPGKTPQRKVAKAA